MHIPIKEPTREAVEEMKAMLNDPALGKAVSLPTLVGGLTPDWMADCKKWIDAVEVMIGLMCDVDTGKLMRRPLCDLRIDPVVDCDPMMLVDALEELRDELHNVRSDHQCEDCGGWCECQTPDDCVCECWADTEAPYDL